MGTLYNNFRFKQRRKELRRKQTRAEEHLWDQIRNKKMNGVKFFRQYGVGSYILDFYAPKMRLCIEVDGEYHGCMRQRQYDEDRTKELGAIQIRIIRFSNKEVLENVSAVLRQVAFYLRNPPL